MAQLKDTIIMGFLRVTNSLFANSLQANTFKAPTISNGSEYGIGINGQVLKSNGTSSYWGNENSYTMITNNQESSTTASNNYNIGDLIILDNQLLRVVNSNIASGGSITIGTNAEIVDLATILKSFDTRISAIE